MRTAIFQLPSFFLVGAPKTGTTSLYSYLKQHPDIYLSPVKEPCFFASEMRPDKFAPAFAAVMRRSNQRLGDYIEGSMSGPNPGGVVTEWHQYLRLFKDAGSQSARGEASVCYLWSSSAATNIKARVPNAKIVMILRDPVDRAFSQYLQYAASGLLTRTFRQHVELCLRNNSPRYGPFRPFLEYGLYHEQVKRYLEAFPPGQVKVYLFEEAWRNPTRFLKDLFDFLGVDPFAEIDTSHRDLEGRMPKAITMHYLVNKSGLIPGLKKLLPVSFQSALLSALFRKKSSIKLDPKDREFTLGYYRSDIQNLAELLGVDLGDWLTGTRPDLKRPREKA